MHLSKTFSRGAAALVAVTLAGCDASTTGVSMSDTPDTPDTPTDAFEQSAAVGTDVHILQNFEVCKTYVGAVGPTVTVDFTVDFNADGAGPQDYAGQITLDDGDCAIVHTYDESNSNGGAQVQRVTVTEQVPAGYDASYVLTKVMGAATVVDPPVAGNSASGDMTSAPDNGFSVEFINTEIFVPGDEGCTPGYWKQEHHFDSYPAGFDPTTPFIGATTGFTYDPALQKPESGNASDLDLLGALTLRGGGVNALIRHAAAGILNANSSVAYAYSAGEVQDLYNVDQDKEALEEANEAGCPLN